MCCQAAAIRLRRHPKKPKTPRADIKSGRAAGSGTADTVALFMVILFPPSAVMFAIILYVPNVGIVPISVAIKVPLRLSRNTELSEPFGTEVPFTMKLSGRIKSF